MKLTPDQSALVAKIESAKHTYSIKSTELQVRQKLERQALKQGLYDLWQRGQALGIPMRQMYTRMGFAQQGQVEQFFKGLGDVFVTVDPGMYATPVEREFELVPQGLYQKVGMTYYHLLTPDGQTHYVQALGTGGHGKDVVAWIPDEFYTDEVESYLTEFTEPGQEFARLTRHNDVHWELKNN